MFYLIFAFLLSFVLCLMLLKFNIFHDTSQGPQKIHTTPTPRTGGLAIFISLWIVGLTFFALKKQFAVDYILLLGSSTFVFMSGFAEDVTGKVPPSWRLTGSFISGIAFIYLMGATVNRLDLPLVDVIFGLQVFSIIFTSFAIAGVSHAFNVIDGFNGLSSGIALLAFSAYSYVSFVVGDDFLFNLSLISLFALIGFFILNYPFGYIFLGDGGAYLIGFLTAVIGVLLVYKHGEVSPWFPLVLVFYPVWEALFSIYRRKFLKKGSAFSPDALHFHQLLYKRIVRKFIGKEANDITKNSLTAPFLWIIQIICVGLGVIFWDNTLILLILSILFASFYSVVYHSIVKFKMGNLLRYES